MASPRPPTPVIPASASVPTPAKSANPAPAASAAPAPAPAPAPPTSAPVPNVTPPAPSQHALTTQAIKSTPTGTTSPSSNQAPSQNDGSRSNPPPAAISQPLVSSNNHAATALPSPSDTAPRSHAASVWGAVFAVLAVIIALTASFWVLRRRREKRRRLWDAQRMPASTFGKYEPESIPEKQANIEATLEADLARLRSLDQQGPIVYQKYDREFSKQSLDFSPMPVSPGGFKIARKPSLRVRDPISILPASLTGDVRVADLSQSAPAYDAKEYIDDSPTKETCIFSSPTANSSPQRNPQLY